jgi:hypothetical protein
MFERAFVGHRFDEDTPIAETVRGISIDGITADMFKFSDASTS